MESTPSGLRGAHRGGRGGYAASSVRAPGAHDEAHRHRGVRTGFGCRPHPHRPAGTPRWTPLSTRSAPPMRGGVHRGHSLPAAPACGPPERGRPCGVRRWTGDGGGDSNSTARSRAASMSSFSRSSCSDERCVGIGSINGASVLHWVRSPHRRGLHRLRGAHSAPVPAALRRLPPSSREPGAGSGPGVRARRRRPIGPSGCRLADSHPLRTSSLLLRSGTCWN